MFSENNRISERQAFRLLTYDLLGLSTLVVPSILGQTAGRDGIFCIVLGVAATLIYVRLLSAAVTDCKGGFPDYLEEVFGKVCGRLIQFCYLVYLFLLAAYTAYLFSDVVRESLLRDESFRLVLILLLVLVLYGLWGGLEGRARVYEILFWFLMIPLFLMLLFAWDEVQTDYWTPVFMSDGGTILTGGYALFVCMTISFLLMFVKNHMEEPAKLYRVGSRAVLFTGGIHAVLYLILLGIFGAKALGTMEYPAVTLMSTVKISGGFFKRADAFMFAVWFFTLYALLSGCVCYGGNVLARLAGRCLKQWKEEKKQCAAAMVLLVPIGGLACGFYYHPVWVEYCVSFLWYIGTPVLLAVPLLILFCRNRKKGGLLMLLIFAGNVMAGCGSAELEDRNFPIELAVQNTENFSETFLEEEGAGNRMIDYTHLKVVILSQKFVENTSAMQEFLELMETKKEIPRNTYVVVAEDAEEIMKLKEVAGESVGNYLEQMFENVSEVKKRAYPTIGMLYQDWKNQCETFFIPYVTIDGDKLAVESYYVWKRGSAAGRIEGEAAELSFFTQNQMEKYLLTLAEGVVVSLSDAHNTITFGEKNGEKTVFVTIKCSGEAVNRSGRLSREEQKELEQHLETYMNGLAGRVLEERRVDVTNSFRKLGAKREWYCYYQEQQEMYEPEVRIQFQTDVDWIFDAAFS